MLNTPLSANELRVSCDSKSLPFTTTEEIKPLAGLIGQQRALNALEFGTGMRGQGYNLYALGPQGTGRHTAIMEYLQTLSGQLPAPDDWVYVSNFQSSHHPKAIRLPPDTGIKYREAMETLIYDLVQGIPALFQSDDYLRRRKNLESEFEEQSEEALEELRKKAQSKNIGLIRTPMGLALAPLGPEDSAMAPEEFNKLPEKARKTAESNIADLQKELSSILQQVPKLQKQHRDKVNELNIKLTGQIIDASIESIRREFDDIPVILETIDDVRADLLTHIDLFITQEQNPALPSRNLSIVREDPKFNRYRVNVIVANDSDGDSKGAPVIFEEHPNLGNIVGRIEHQSQYGTLVTDFTMIRPGALHRANGGYLVLDARKIVSEMFSWEALKRALRNRKIVCRSAAEEIGLVSTTTLEPQPIDLDVKVVLVGERMLYYLLCELDPDFLELFKVQVDFDEITTRSKENVTLYSQLIASILQKENLHPLNSAAVACAIEHLSRLAADTERLSLNVGKLTDLLREADFWATKDAVGLISESHVDKAISEQLMRSSRIRERSLEAIQRDMLLVSTTGEKSGQINGLSVMQLGDTSFGRPSRITARVRMGSGKVLDIEREIELGGPIHTKGVLILSGFLAARYALGYPVSLWASIVFEQSYGMIDGDSASSAELYALMSALAEIPIKQSFAVTGSVNQFGEVQAIGGVNEKIEGFFDVCKARGLTGEQGVLIPKSNVGNLMLRKDIVEESRQGRFSIYPVSHIDQGIQLLTGIKAGEASDDGKFPEGTINYLVEKKLTEFAKIRTKLSETDAKRGNQQEEAS